MEMTEKKPLLTFALFAYNQEQYIEEAIQGAFSQTYSPLEIVLSDDCSSDNTFAILEKMAKEYKGPHKIVLNRNKNNLGIALHIDNIVRNYCKGELIILQAGDDISHPKRVQFLFERWNLENRRSYCISSNFVEMEEDGLVRFDTEKDLKKDLNLKPFIKYYDGDIGATYAFHPDVITKFTPMETGNFEDKCIAFRSKLLGGYTRINKVLLYHRKSGISNFKSVLEEQNTILKVRPIILKQMRNDLSESVIKEKYSKKKLSSFENIIDRHIKFYLLMKNFIDSNGAKKLFYLLKILLNGDFYRIRLWRYRIISEIIKITK